MTNTAPAASPQDRRIDGINAVTVEFRPCLPVTPPAEIAAAIRALTALGRSARWKDAVEAWAKLVEDETLSADMARSDARRHVAVAVEMGF